jgi:zinc transport system permease protein
MFDLQIIDEVIELYGHAFPAAFLMAVVFSVFGVFVVLKRMVFIGITLSEVAACGVAAALLFNSPPFITAAIFCLIVVALLAYPYKSTLLPGDTILGSIFIFASGMSILLVARSGFGLEKVKAILYGNLLFASNHDLFIIAAVMLPALFMVIMFYRPMLYSFLDRESASTLGIKVWRFELLFFVFLGLIVASSSKIAGVMLVFCYLVIPAASSLLITRSMEKVIIGAITFSIVSTWLGIITSYVADLPPNQLIAVISCAILLIAAIFHLGKSIMGQALAGTLALVCFVLLVSFLNGLSVKPMVSAKPIVSQKIKQNEKFQTKGWPAKISQMKSLIHKDKNAGTKLAIKLLKQKPPSFFFEEIKQTLTDIFCIEAKDDAEGLIIELEKLSNN